MSDFSWIKSQLADRFPRANLNLGVDLNGNGSLEPNERLLDSDQNGIRGDHRDWENFLRDNYPALTALGGIFRWGNFFKPDNPLHDLLAIDVEIQGRSEQETADPQITYELLSLVLQKTKERLVGKNLTPREKLQLLDAEILTHAMAEGNPAETYCLLFLAAAWELGWPVFLAQSPGGVFLRWKEKGEPALNFHEGRVKLDAEFQESFPISKSALRNRVYLKELSRNEILAWGFLRRGLQKKSRENLQGAFADFNRALDFNPRLPSAWIHRGMVKNTWGDHRAAIVDYEKALALNQNEVTALRHRAEARGALKNFDGALQDLDRALALQPDNAEIFFERAQIRKEMSLWVGAMADLNFALILNPNWAEAYFLRGSIHLLIDDLEGALLDFDRAVELDPGNAMYWQQRGILRLNLGDIPGAVADMERIWGY